MEVHAQSHTAALTSRALRTTIIGVVINAALAVGKGMAGLLGNSYALIADAVESTLDIVSSAVVWGGLRIASVPPDKNHPYGHGKAEPLAAVVVSVTLLGVAASLAFGSIRELLSETNEPPASFTLIVLVLVIVIKETLARFVHSVGAEVESTAVKTDAWHHRSDALTSAAAFVGISVAVLGGKGYEDADDWAALFACLIIAYNGYRLLRPALAEVMDAAPNPEVEQNIRDTASSVEGVVAIEQCVVRKMGLEYFADLHVEVDPNMSVREGHRIAHQVKDAVRGAYPRVRDVLIHIEPADTPPDVSAASPAKPCRSRTDNEHQGESRMSAMFPVGAQSYSFRKFDLEGSVQQLKALGADLMEFCGVHFPADPGNPDLERVKHMLASEGVRVPCYGVEGFSATDFAANRRKFEFAKAIGAGILTADPEPGSFDNLDELCEEFGIKVAIHNHGPGARYDKVEDTLKAVEGHSPMIGACVDTGHVLRSGEVPQEVIRALGGRVISLHLKDWRGTDETIIGQGDLDVTAVARELMAAGFSGPVIMEYEESPENPVPDMKVGLQNWREAIEKAAASE